MFRISVGARCYVVALLVAIAPAVFAQRWEFGVGGGGSFFTKQTLTSPAGSVDASFQPGFVGTAYAAQMGRRYGGEVRYAYFFNDMKLEGMGKSFSFGGRSQLVTYDFQIFLGNRESKVRPFVSVGGGVRWFEGTGQDMAVQPLEAVAVLTRTHQMRPVASAGAGIRIQTSARTALRAELKAYFSQNPSDIITPVTGTGGNSWIVNFAPMLNIAFVF